MRGSGSCDGSGDEIVIKGGSAGAGTGAGTTYVKPVRGWWAVAPTADQASEWEDVPPEYATAEIHDAPSREHSL
eukprot:5481848-Pleurochrysis_carterae.AAC.1